MAASSEELELLTKLLSFYKSRYSGKELEKKFNDACTDLISTNDLKRASYIKFCVENDIEPKIPKITSSSSGSAGGGSWTGGCGGPPSRGGC